MRVGVRVRVRVRVWLGLGLGRGLGLGLGLTNHNQVRVKRAQMLLSVRADALFSVDGTMGTLAAYDLRAEHDLHHDLRGEHDGDPRVREEA